MKRYKIIFVTVEKNGVWVRKEEKHVVADSFNQIILELSKTVTSKFYLLEVWEEITDSEYGGYRLVFPGKTGEIKPLDRVLESYIREIEKTIGSGETVHLDTLYTQKLRTILKEMSDRFANR